MSRDVVTLDGGHEEARKPRKLSRHLGAGMQVALRMADIKLGWFDLAYWVVAFAVAYYVAYVFDIKKFFTNTKRKDDGSKIKGPKDKKDNGLKLEKVGEA